MLLLLHLGLFLGRKLFRLALLVGLLLFAQPLLLSLRLLLRQGPKREAGFDERNEPTEFIASSGSKVHGNSLRQRPPSS